STDTRVLPGTEGGVHPFFSPNGRSIGFARTLEPLQLRRVDLAGGSARILAPLGGPWHGSWSRDDMILFIGQPTMQRVPAAGGPAIALGNEGSVTGSDFQF